MSLASNCNTPKQSREPPFIGKCNIRAALGDGYVDATRSTWIDVPESADFVMYWWHIAAEKVCAGQAKRFGFISTNSIKQLFNRRVVQAYLEAKKSLSLVFVIPDHPWVDSADGADVRIVMTTGAAGDSLGRLMLVREETHTDGHEIAVNFQEEYRGKLFAELRGDAPTVTMDKLTKVAWPTDRLEQVEAIRSAIGSQSLVPDEIASQFKAPSKAKQTIIEILNAWQSLGIASVENGNYRLLA